MAACCHVALMRLYGLLTRRGFPESRTGWNPLTCSFGGFSPSRPRAAANPAYLNR